jgi:hypothetical protein
MNTGTGSGAPGGRKDPRAVRTVLLGNRSPSALENAVGDPAWRDRLTTSLTVLASKYDWAQGLLAAPGEQA